MADNAGAALAGSSGDGCGLLQESYEEITMRQLTHLIVCVVGVSAATAIGMTHVVVAQGPPPSAIVPCGVPPGAPAGGTSQGPIAAGPPGGAVSVPSNLPSGLRLRRVQGNVYMLSGAGANIAVQVGVDGVLIVDSGRADMATAVIAALRQLTPAPLRTIINSTGDADHTGGNEVVGRAGLRVTSGFAAGGGPTVGAAIVARQAVMDRMITEKAPECALPTATYDVYPTRSLYFNDEGIELRHVAAAHSDGDSLVFFRRSDVVVAGEIFNTNLYPFIDIEHGGSVDGVVAALNQLLEITIPALKQERGTYVIPGRGRVADEADVSEYRDMVTIVRDRVKALVARKMSLEQVKAERPTLDYDGRYGGTDGPWTPDRFVEALYRSLSPPPAAPVTRPAGGPRR